MVAEYGTMAGRLRGPILCLRIDDDIAPGVCGLACPAQQPLQLGQRHDIDARRAGRHAGAVYRIEHPAGHGDHSAGRPLHQEKLAGRALLDTAHQQPAPEVRMPAVMDFRFLPDMGRMNR